MIAAKGTGTLRERRPGVWEIRVVAGTDVLSGRVIQRSVTFHGDAAAAETYRRELAADYARRREAARAAPLLVVADLLPRWLAADHPWRPSTVTGYVSTVRGLLADPMLARTRVVALTPRQLRAAFVRWRADGATETVVGGRFRALRAAISWAHDERIIDLHPIRNMRGPARPAPRRPLTGAQVRALLAGAEANVFAAVANDTGRRSSLLARQGAEQDLLLVRLAADTGARRGELCTLRFDDLDGRVLRIERAVSGGQLGPTKSGAARSLTVGASTARLWEKLRSDWETRAPSSLGPWVFAADTAHQRRLTAGALDHRFRRLRDQAGVADASLHRLRHSVATFLVARGEILQAQARLGHRDAATTLRNYAYAFPLSDRNVADAIDDYLLPAPSEDVATEASQSLLNG